MKRVLFNTTKTWFGLILVACAALQAQNSQTATLVIRADADCKLSVDGEAKGVLHPEDRMRVVVQLGEHLIEATPTAGGKRWEQIVNLNEPKTQVLTITLPKPVGGTTATNNTATAATNVAPRNLYWIDPNTTLMWAAQDNGQDVTWQEASGYCKSLATGNFRDWRLPRARDLQAIQGEKSPKGGIRSTGIAWSGFAGSLAGTAQAYSFLTKEVFSTETNKNKYYRALCVRGSVAP